MPRITLARLQGFIQDAFIASGLTAEHAAAAADVYMRATLRGVGHHDVYDLPYRLKGLAEGWLNPRPEIKLLHKFQACENYDGGNGPGEVCASFLLDRVMHLADEYGIGFGAMRNSNHFLAAAPYVERAAEAGYLALIFSRTGPLMGAPGAAKPVIGNQPMGFAAPAANLPPLMLDICLAYASIGKLGAMAAAGEKIPDYWGLAADGRPTSEPAAVIHGTSLPIGEHKGFGLALLAEILTGVLAEGPVLDEPSPYSGPWSGDFSQAAIVIKPSGLLGEGVFPDRNAGMIRRLQAAAPGIMLPGARSARHKEDLLRAGGIELTPAIVAELNDWAKKLGLAPLS